MVVVTTRDTFKVRGSKLGPMVAVGEASTRQDHRGCTPPHLGNAALKEGRRGGWKGRVSGGLEDGEGERGDIYGNG